MLNIQAILLLCWRRFWKCFPA